MNVDQQPAAVALVRSVDDVFAVVASTAHSGLRLIALGTGHAASSVGPLSRTVLVRTIASTRSTNTGGLKITAVKQPVVDVTRSRG
jgi:hypothetical protein